MFVRIKLMSSMLWFTMHMPWKFGTALCPSACAPFVCVSRSVAWRRSVLHEPLEEQENGWTQSQKDELCIRPYASRLNESSFMLFISSHDTFAIVFTYPINCISKNMASFLSQKHQIRFNFEERVLLVGSFRVLELPKTQLGLCSH